MLIKPARDLRALTKNGKKIGKILASLAKLVAPGVTTLELDTAAERFVRAAGGAPAFKGYTTGGAQAPFPATVCVSINSELVHGIPSATRVLQMGDLVSLDIGMVWPSSAPSASPSRFRSRASLGASEGKPEKNGVFTDTAITLVVGGSASPEVTKLLRVTRQALEEGMRAAQPGASVAAIGKAIEGYVKSEGPYGIVRDLVGHGVGHAVHEEPMIPNYYDSALESIKLMPGMVIAIEPMISLGSPKVKTAPDGWTIVMSDKSLCAHFEHTLIITKKGNEVITRRPGEKKEPV